MCICHYFHLRVVTMILNGTSALYSALPIFGLMHQMMNDLGKEGWQVPDVDGKPYWMSKEKFEKEYSAFVLDYPVVKFYLHTRRNRSSAEEIILYDEESLAHSHLRRSDPTIIVIHGWRGSYRSPVNTLVREAFLRSRAYNVIHVDWSAHASTVYYPNARYAVPHIGKVVAQFIDFLRIRRHKPSDQLVIVGHSLGAHVAGFAGKQIRREGVDAVIIGLDPAYPLFSYSDCASRLCESDAKYVESIHTCGGYLGFLQPIGRASFYPNGGEKQPACGEDTSGSCANAMAYEYYAEAIIRKDFNSVRCKDYQSAVDNACGTEYSGEKMGWPKPDLSGIFYVPVNSKPPYGVNYTFACPCNGYY